jgi:restriction endonuclease Mrr
MSTSPGRDERRALTQKARVAVLDAVRALGGEATRKDILDRALSHGGFTAEELAVAVPDRNGKDHGFVESRLAFELSNLKREGLLTNPERGVWRLTEAGAKKPEPLIRVRVGLDRLAELRAMSHEEYLTTPEWQRTREAALERAGHRCSRDRRHKNALDVHHTVRVRVGAELPADLVVLCHSCFEEQGLARRASHTIADEALIEAISIAPPTAAPASVAVAVEPVQPAQGDRSLLRRIFSRA